MPNTGIWCQMVKMMSDSVRCMVQSGLSNSCLMVACVIAVCQMLVWRCRMIVRSCHHGLLDVSGFSDDRLTVWGDLGLSDGCLTVSDGYTILSDGVRWFRWLYDHGLSAMVLGGSGLSDSCLTMSYGYTVVACQMLGLGLSNSCLTVSDNCTIMACQLVSDGSGLWIGSGLSDDCLTVSDGYTIMVCQMVRSWLVRWFRFVRCMVVWRVVSDSSALSDGMK